MSTPAPSASEKNEAPESNLASNGGVTSSLDLLYPNPGGMVFSDDIWMVDIPGVDHDIYLIQELTLFDSLSADNLSIEVSVYDDTEGA